MAIETHAAPAVSAGELADFVRRLFKAAGMGEEDARLLSASLVDSDCHGMSTHGTARVAGYIAQLAIGQVNPTPRERVVADKPSALLVDADRGFGAPVGIRAVERAMPKARETGACLAGVTNVAHFGAAGFYTRYAAERGYLALAMSSTSPSVVPFGGRTPRIGNSPVSFAAPGREHPELNMDMALSMASRGRIKVLQERGERLPEGWAVDTEGNATTDPVQALRGAVLPSGGHKGSAMSLMVEMLASGLTGAQLTKDVRHAGFTSVGSTTASDDVTVGNFYLVIDADVFGTADQVRERASAIAEYVRQSPPAPGVERVIAPGDLERERHEHVSATGVVLLPSTVRELRELAGRHGVAVPAPLAAAS